MKNNTVSKKVRRVLLEAREEQWKELELQKSDISQVPRDIGLLVSLTKLDLSNNMIASLPPDFGNLARLNTLILKRNFLPEIPPPVLALSNLTALDISYNYIESVPQEISKLRVLRRLDLGNNRMTEVANEVGNLLDLEVLFLRENKLTRLPAGCGQLAKLRSLDLSGNPLEEPLATIMKSGPAAVVKYLRTVVADSMAAQRKTMSTTMRMTDENFDKLIRRLKEDCFPDKRLETALRSIKGNFFSSLQLKQMVSMFEYAHQQSQIAIEFYPRIIDPAMYYLVLEAINVSSEKDRVQKELKLGVYSEKNLFDPQDPAGFYVLDLSKPQDREVVSKLCDLEMKNLGQNLKLILLDGKDIELFDVNNTTFFASRCDPGFRLICEPEIMDYGGKVSLRWKAPAARENGNDWIGLCIADDLDGVAPIGKDWEDCDRKHAGFRVFLRGRTEGSATLEVKDCYGAFEARYYCQEAAQSADATAESAADASANTPLGTGLSMAALKQERSASIIDKLFGRRQTLAPIAGEHSSPLGAKRAESVAKMWVRDKKNTRLRDAGLRSVARSNTIYVGQKGKPVRRPIPQQGILQVVYLAYDEENAFAEKPVAIDGERFSGLIRQIEAEFSEKARRFAFEAGLNAFHFTTEQAADLLQIMKGPDGSGDDEWLWRMSVCSYARCTDRNEFIQTFRKVLKPSLLRKVIEFLRLDEDVDNASGEVEQEKSSRSLSHEQLQTLVEELSKERVLSKRIALVRKSLEETFLTCEQLRAILTEFHAPGARIDLTIALHRFISDRDQFDAFLESLFDESDRELVMDAIIE